jgi:hypothetical protein
MGERRAIALLAVCAIAGGCFSSSRPSAPPPDNRPIRRYLKRFPIDELVGLDTSKMRTRKETIGGTPSQLVPVGGTLVTVGGSSSYEVVTKDYQLSNQVVSKTATIVLNVRGGIVQFRLPARISTDGSTYTIHHPIGTERVARASIIDAGVEHVERIGPEPPSDEQARQKRALRIVGIAFLAALAIGGIAIIVVLL